MREDVDCEEFIAFCRQFGDEIATSILEDICCGSRDSTWPFRLKGMRSESHDREGNNHTITGTLEYKARAWMFEVQSGNWNGTEVKSWEQCSLMPASPPPPQSVWLVASIDAVLVRVIVAGLRPKLASMTAAMIREKERYEAATSQP